MTWLAALREVVREYQGLEFSWGTADCCRFTCDYVRRLTGYDPGANLEYISLLGARRVLENAGSMCNVVDKLLPRVEREPQPGDVVVIRLGGVEGLESAGVCAGYCVFTMLEGEGLLRAPLDKELILGVWSPWQAG